METAPKLNVSNPDAITYHTDELVFTILGSIRLEGLDRLRVTIRTEMVNRKFPHYLNDPDLAALPMHHVGIFEQSEEQGLIYESIL